MYDTGFILVLTAIGFVLLAALVRGFSGTAQSSLRKSGRKRADIAVKVHCSAEEQKRQQEQEQAQRRKSTWTQVPWTARGLALRYRLDQEALPPWERD
jgi:hypothetical protein